MSLGLNVLLIFIFLLLGSVFSGTELALVSLRGSQIEQMEQEDARGAKVAKIARDPNTFLSTVQIGVTLCGFLSASFGASSISPYLIPVVEGWGVPTGIAGGLVNIVLTLIISYCSIVISEMVPKRIAMQRTEQIARAVVPAIDVFATICRPIIWLIGKNTNGIVRVLGFDPQQTESEVSDDELRVLVSSNTNLSKDERTILDDVFALRDMDDAADGGKVKERYNGSGATVRGFNVEGRAAFTRWFELQAGVTLQQSRYKEPEFWSEDAEVPPVRRMFRTPDTYGYFTASFKPVRNFTADLSGTCTGSMLVQHMAGSGVAQDVAVSTPSFFDMNIRLSYDVRIYKEITMQLYGGVQNLFNAYQKDFDKGVDRDSGYIYGPSLPRSWFVGAKFSF